jgi:uncharacterized membrane-anchored protein YhcB (DUF1043 family)
LKRVFEGDEDMARMTSMDALEAKIEKAQQQVSRAKKQYDDALAKLSDLLDKLLRKYRERFYSHLVLAMIQMLMAR